MSREFLSRLSAISWRSHVEGETTFKNNRDSAISFSALFSWLKRDFNSANETSRCGCVVDILIFLSITWPFLNERYFNVICVLHERSHFSSVPNLVTRLTASFHMFHCRYGLSPRSFKNLKYDSANFPCKKVI